MTLDCSKGPHKINVSCLHRRLRMRDVFNAQPRAGIERWLPFMSVNVKNEGTVTHHA